MIEPQKATVRPRVISPTLGQSLLLEDVVADFDNLACARPIQISGGPGSGKTTALRHLRAVVEELTLSSGGPNIVFLDEPISLEEVFFHAQEGCCVVFTVRKPLSESPAWLSLCLVPWEEDDLLEYLLNRHKDHCGRIFAGLRQNGDAGRLKGNPELWAITLDYLATQPTVPPIWTALRNAFLAHLTLPNLTEDIKEYCLAQVQGDADLAALAAKNLSPGGRWRRELLRLLRHPTLQLVLAVEKIVDDLAAGIECDYLGKTLSREAVCLVAEQIHQSSAIANLKGILAHKDVRRHPMAASICHQLDRQWLPALVAGKPQALPELRGAYLDHADWPGLELAGAQMAKADLSFANLAGASLVKACAYGSNFQKAVLTKANMRSFWGKEADFSESDLRQVNAVAANFGQANLRQARLDGASFFEADLQHADFSGASLVKTSFVKALLEGVTLAEADAANADFTGAQCPAVDFRFAQLWGARWHKACLEQCNFEGLNLGKANFSAANLNGALLTASCLPGADFSDADLSHAGLADINWEGANLRNADLRGASFHLGSSRSGLVGSPIAREGSMTGFYTDEFTEQDFKTPEEIRKANLCGADLRGANVEGVDFYLVDLREAHYDQEQAAHFRACGAILTSRGR